jgi:hypothetical protein
MPIPILMSVVLVFVIWLQYEIRKSSRSSKKSADKFWRMEASANLTRRVDISGLDYITVRTDMLPLSDLPDQTINSYRDTIVNLAGRKAINLSDMTNTELKLRYGAANLKELTEYDNNYTALVSILHKWGERLYAQGYKNEALSVLEYAVMCITDVGKTYILLSEIYKELNTPEKIDPLTDILPYTKIQRKDELIDELKRIKAHEII